MSYHEETAEKVNKLLEGGDFKSRCWASGVKPTRRQARKFLRKSGRAYHTVVNPDGRYEAVPLSAWAGR
jgi:hypothetical protein